MFSFFDKFLCLFLERSLHSNKYPTCSDDSYDNSRLL